LKKGGYSNFIALIRFFNARNSVTGTIHED